MSLVLDSSVALAWFFVDERWLLPLATLDGALRRAAGELNLPVMG